METQLTVDVAAGIIGILVSAFFTWFPKLRTAYARLSTTKKSLIMMGVITLFCVLIVTSACANLWKFTECSKVGVMHVVEIWFFLLVGNQGAYSLIPQPKDVQEAKRLRTE